MLAAKVVATNIPAIDNLTLTALVPNANGVIMAIQAWRDARLTFIEKARACGEVAVVEGQTSDLTVPAGIALLIQRLFSCVEALAAMIEKVGKQVVQRAKSTRASLSELHAL